MIKNTNRSGSILLSAALLTALSTVGLYQGGKFLWGEDAVPFFKGILRDPKTNGAFTPCSRFVADDITKPLHALRGAVQVLEVGAGTGQFSKRAYVILKDLLDKNIITEFHLDLVEIDAAYCDILRKKFADMPEITVHCADVTTLSKADNYYDAIISAVPFTRMSVDVVDSILKSYVRMVKPCGSLSYVELMWLPNIKKTILSFAHKEAETVAMISLLKDFQAHYKVETHKVWMNITPAYVHHLSIAK